MPTVARKEKVIVIQDDKEVVVEQRRAHSKVLKKSLTVSTKVPRALQKSIITAPKTGNPNKLELNHRQLQSTKEPPLPKSPKTKEVFVRQDTYLGLSVKQSRLSPIDSGRKSSLCIKSNRMLIKLKTEVSPGPGEYENTYHDMALKSKRASDVQHLPP